ncbi:Pycsar system effector family protein [Clostridium sp. AM42-4]|uniref:Pycsar system effector family protein n=1 Tax=Clostridium sp. AM42-4 TaxID=2292305 RepID=UPI000E507D64|nr:Pycsar system effector family protein [Clostridium sp. AM42-4]RHS91035.1 hypothetical protein DW922_01020 [Clostridium sp. AM42-4]
MMDEMNGRLEQIFANVNTWLHFAEAKNAANIALVVAAITGLLGLEEKNIPIYLICIMFSCSGVFSMLSFCPDLGSADKNKKLTRKTNGNLLLFKDIKGFSAKEYAEEIARVYFPNKNQTIDQYQMDLAGEIVYNAGIVSRKYAFFKMAFFFDMLAFGSLLVFLIAA